MPPSTHSQPHQASKYIASQYKSNICFVYEQILHRKKYIIIWKISKRKFDIYLNTFELAIYTKIQLASIEKQSKHGITKTKIYLNIILVIVQIVKFLFNTSTCLYIHSYSFQEVENEKIVDFIQYMYQAIHPKNRL